MLKFSEKKIFTQYSYFSQIVKNLVNKSIIYHKCHNFIGLYSKLPNLIIFGQIGYDNVGDSVFSRVGCQVYLNCLGQCTLFTLGHSASATASASASATTYH